MRPLTHPRLSCDYTLLILSLEDSPSSWWEPGRSLVSLVSDRPFNFTLPFEKKTKNPRKKRWGRLIRCAALSQSKLTPPLRCGENASPSHEVESAVFPISGMSVDLVYQIHRHPTYRKNNILTLSDTGTIMREQSVVDPSRLLRLQTQCTGPHPLSAPDFLFFRTLPNQSRECDHLKHLEIDF